MPASLSSSACSSSRVISSVMALMRAAFSRIAPSRPTASTVSSAQRRMMSRHLAHLRLEAGDLEQGDGLGGLLHLVDGVVEQADQVLDVAAVERRDEGAPHPQQHVAGDGVGLVLMGDDAAAGFGHTGAAFQQVAQRHGAVHQGAGMAVEQREEFLLARHQGLEKAQHASSNDLNACLLALPPRQNQAWATGFSEDGI